MTFNVIVNSDFLIKFLKEGSPKMSGVKSFPSDVVTLVMLIWSSKRMKTLLKRCRSWPVREKMR